jgi:CheY-like chemotaxis protein
MPQKQETLVVVEDFLISKLVGALLRKQGYPVVVAGPSEAAGLLRSEARCGILLTNSPAIFLEFAEKVPLVYLTSFPDPDLQAAFRDCRVVRKPFAPGELIQAVGELTGAAGSFSATLRSC